MLDFNDEPSASQQYGEVERNEIRAELLARLESVLLTLEANRWALWLEEEQRHLIWMCAQRCKWKDIAARFGCEKSTARRRWHRALNLVADQLNQGSEK